MTSAECMLEAGYDRVRETVKTKQASAIYKKGESQGSAEQKGGGSVIKLFSGSEKGKP